MIAPRLANIFPAADWTRFSANAFAKLPHRLVVVPIFGFGEHGMGLPIEAEEALGTAILHRACDLLTQDGPAPLITPPLRFGPAPYASQFFGIDPDTGLDWLREVADGIRRARFSKLVLLSTSPWHREWIDAAALDLHVEKGLSVFKLHLSDIGLSLHPSASAESRAQVQAVAAHLLRVTPQPVEAGDERDTDFRPGAYLRPSPVTPAALPEAFEPAQWLDKSGALCAELLAEIGGRARHFDGQASAGKFGELWQPYGQRYLGSLSARDLRALRPSAKAVAIVPVSATEQHGPHLPVGVDALLGEGLLAHALARLAPSDPVWVAPAITVGKSVEHRDFAGTLSISSKTLRALLHAQVAQLGALGFSTIAFWNTHGGNSAVLNYTIRELQGSSGLRVGRLESRYQAPLDPREKQFGFHAGHWETALMLALAPELVDPAAAVREFPAGIDGPGKLRPERSPLTHAWTTSELSASGVMGDATAATREQGIEWVEQTGRSLAERLRHLTA